MLTVALQIIRWTLETSDMPVGNFNLQVTLGSRLMCLTDGSNKGKDAFQICVVFIT